MKIAITTSSFAKFSEEPLRLLADRNIEWVLNPYGRVLTEDESKEIMRGCTAIIAGTEQLGSSVMDVAPGLKAIVRLGAGMDNVDMDAARVRNITVRNTPDGPTRAVAELTLGYALDLMRQISRMDRELRSGEWKKRMGCLLQGKRIGIIGFGRIGNAVGEVFALMGCEVAFFDPAIEPSSPPRRQNGHSFQPMERDALLAWADIITLHCAKPRDGSIVLDAEAIASMKEGAWLINAARGGIIDEKAMVAALESGRLAGAALDVYAEEPYKGPLAFMPQVVLTPHIGSYAREARIKMEIDSVIELLDAVGEVPK